MQNINWKIIRFKSKLLADKKNNPVMVRVSYAGRWKYLSLVNYRSDNVKLTANTNNWDDDDGCYINDDDRNKTLATIERRIENYLERVNVNRETFTLQSFEQALVLAVDATSFYSLIEAQIKDLEEQGNEGYARTFRHAYSAVKRFTGNKDLELTNLDRSWSQKFTRYMDKNGCGANTISIYLRAVQRVYNIARENKLVKDELNFDIPSDDTNKKWVLSKKSMMSIINADIPESSKRMRHSLNYITFAYFAGGLNFMDLAILKWNKNIDGEYVIYHRRKLRGQSKKKKMMVKITPQIAKILNCYKNDGGYLPNGYIFPIVLDLQLTEDKKHARIKNARKRTNIHFRQIAENVSVKDYDKLSFRVLRDTFASVLFNEKGRPIEKVSQAMGHSDIRTTQIYLKGFDQDVIDSILEEDLY